MIEASTHKQLLKEKKIYTQLFDENKINGLLICGQEPGYSINDEDRDKKGEDRNGPLSFFSDKNVNNYDFRNTVVKWFNFWGFSLNKNAAEAGPFERSILQTNWLHEPNRSTKNRDMKNEFINDPYSFLTICKTFKPGLIFFFSLNLHYALNSNKLKNQVESVFGKPISKMSIIQKEIVSNGKTCIKFKFGFQKFETVDIISVPHPSSRGLTDDYIRAFKNEINPTVKAWWSNHTNNITDKS